MAEKVRGPEYFRSYYQQNKDKFKKYKVKNRGFIWEAKKRPCADCGVQYDPWIMDFDHRDPSQKEFGIAAYKGREKTRAEMEKCDVVCSNCHRERTHRRMLQKQ